MLFKTHNSIVRANALYWSCCRDQECDAVWMSSSADQAMSALDDIEYCCRDKEHLSDMAAGVLYGSSSSWTLLLYTKQQERVQ